MNKSLTRSIAFWLLLILSLASAGIGGWLIAGQVGTMTTTLLDGTATGIEVYVGQSLVVVGAALLGAGVIGLLLAVALTAAQALIPSRSAAVIAPIDEWTEDSDDREPVVEGASPREDVDEAAAADDAQNGSSGSTATATKISVK